MRVLKNYAPVLTQGFGVNGHLGLDIVGQGTTYNLLDTIVSCFKGTVIEVRNNCKGFEPGGSYGNYVLIDHNNGFKTRYAHLESVKVWVGQVVEENQELGFMGNTGTSYGGHLHFEIIKDGGVINPYNYIFGNSNFVPKPITLPTTHKVVKDDTVAKICLKYYGVAEQKYFDLIKQANGLNDKFLIVIGQVLNIPIYKEEVKPIEPPKEEKPIEEPPIENNDTDDHSSDKEDKPNNDTENEQTIGSDTDNQEIKAHPNLFVEIFKIIVKFLKEMFKK